MNKTTKEQEEKELEERIWSVDLEESWLEGTMEEGQFKGKRFITEEGAIIHSHPTYELANTTPSVRIRIPEGVERDEALYYLSEISKMLEEDWFKLDDPRSGSRPKPRATGEREARWTEDEL